MDGSMINALGDAIASSSTAIDPGTLAAYAAAQFQIDEPEVIPFMVDMHAPALDRLMLSRGHSTMAFITPYNPGMVVSEELNQAYHAHMVEENREAGLRTLPGRGGCQGGEWPPEMSQAVFDITVERAATLGTRWGQDAIVWHEVGGTPRLMLLR